MQGLLPATSEENEAEYRAIEAALLESVRGRWFLAEHGRRARRLDSALLEDAIGRLQTSLRQPPALLGQLQAEIGTLKAHLGEIRAMMLAKAKPAEGDDNPPPHAILKAAEDVHDIAWSLQANPFDPRGCEEIARNASKLYVLSQTQAIASERTMQTVHALDAAAERLDAMLETVIHELKIDPGQQAN